MTLRWSRDSSEVWRAVVDRPHRKNAIDLQTMADLELLVDEAEKAPALRVLTLRGAGDAFVSGGDLQSFSDFEDIDQVAAMAQRMKQILRRLECLPCWTVAAINGDAYGGGCEMSLAFDFRIAATEARFGFVQARYAIPPGWGGLTRLVEQVGRSQALMWLATASIVDADQAHQAGLVDEVAAPGTFDDHLELLVGKLAGNSRRLIKTLKNGAQRTLSKTREESLKAELEPFCELWMTDEHRRQIEKFLTRGKS